MLPGPLRARRAALVCVRSLLLAGLLAVPAVAQDGDEMKDILGNLGSASVVDEGAAAPARQPGEGTVSGRVPAREHRGVRRQRHGRRGHGRLEDDPLGGEAVHHRRVRGIPSGETETVRPQGIDRDEEHVPAASME